MNEGSYHLADSTEAYIALPSVAAYQLGTPDFTVEAWVKTYSGGPILGILDSASSPGFYVQVNPGTIGVYTQDGTSFAQGSVSGVSVCDSIWRHIAAVRTGANFVIYLDTVAAPIRLSTNGSPPLNINSSDRMTVGAVDSTSIGNQHYDGLLSEVRFWNEARTHNQISVNASLRLQVDSIKSSLIGYWPAIFGIIPDFSPTRNTVNVHGQLVGSGEEPPLLGPNVETLFYVYYGVYALETETAPNSWSPAGQLALTSTGFVVLNIFNILEGAKFHGAQLKWSSSGNSNSTSGSLKFKMESSNPVYWPSKQVGELCEGSLQPNGSASVNVRDRLMPRRIGCGIVLNVGKGLVLANSNGAAVVSPGSATAPGHFCRYAEGKVYDMMTQLAVQVHAAGPGHSVQFAAPEHGQDSLQNFEFNDTGNVVLKSAPTVALGVGGANNVVTVQLNTTDDSQKWLALSETRILWNDVAPSAVLNGDGTSLSVEAKSERNPKQSWYTFRTSFFCEANNLALTLSGGPAPGVPLRLQKWSPANTNQEFVLHGGLLVHKPSDLIVVAQGSISNGASVVLADKASNKSTLGAHWSYSAFAPPVYGTDDHVYPLDTATEGANDLVTYKITIRTSNAWFSGTRDQIKASLYHVVNEAGARDALPYRILNDMDHTPFGNPFKTGRSATFIFQDRRIGRVHGVQFILGENNWFFRTNWNCDRVEVHQSNMKRGWGFGYLLWKRGGRWMLPFEAIALQWDPDRTDATMQLGMAPADDPRLQQCGWYHTWISVVSDADPTTTTWFDCAGGHGGEGAQYNVLQRRCVLNDVVVMSTGKPISPTNPLQPTYGTSRTDDVGNANVRADGKINWDGQCHQIANRYLYVTPSHTSIDEVGHDNYPSGYTVGCAVFGRYGIGFPEWCRRIGVSDVPDDAYNNKILSYLLTFRDQVLRDPAPDGPDMVHLLKKFRSDGFTVAQIATFFTLSVEEVEKLLADDSYVRAGIDW